MPVPGRRGAEPFGLNGVRRCAVTLVETLDNGPKRAQVAREIGDRFLEGVEAVLERVGIEVGTDWGTGGLTARTNLCRVSDRG